MTKVSSAPFNRLWGRTEDGYQRRVLGGLRRGAVMMGAYALICGAMALAMWKLPGSFLPVEDQGEIMVQYTLPAGATAVRTAEVRRQVTDWFLTKEKANTEVIFTVDGFSFSGSGQNAGMAFVSLKKTGRSAKATKIPRKPLRCAPTKSWALSATPPCSP